MAAGPPAPLFRIQYLEPGGAERWTDAGAASYRLLGSLERDSSRPDLAIDASDGVAGALEPLFAEEEGIS